MIPAVLECPATLPVAGDPSARQIKALWGEVLPKLAARPKEPLVERLLRIGIRPAGTPGSCRRRGQVSTEIVVPEPDMTLARHKRFRLDPASGPRFDGSDEGMTEQDQQCRHSLGTG